MSSNVEGINRSRRVRNLDTKRREALGFPGGTVVKNPPANAGDTDSVLGPGRSHMLQSN